MNAPVDMRAIRAFRLLRLLKAGPLRGSGYLALSIAKEELLVYLGATLVLLHLSALGVYYFERDAQPDKFATRFGGR